MTQHQKIEKNKIIGDDSSQIFWIYVLTTLACNEYNVHKVVDFLNKFLHISGLELNSQKSMAFRYGTSNFKPRWLQKHKWTWATDTVSNLLGTEFGLNLETLMMWMDF
jgi:hypothetical protein